VARIPSHVWHFCSKELKLYPLRKAELEEARQRANLAYEEGGYRGYDRPFVQSTGGAPSPVAVKLEYIERIMSAPEVLLNMRRCQYVEDVLATLNDEGKMVLEECFWKPKRDAELIAKNLNMSVRRLYYVKHEIVERLAIRWGML